MFYSRILLFLVFLLLNGAVIAQIPVTPTPTPRPGSRQANLPGVSADSEKYDVLRSIEMMVPKDRAGAHPLLDPKKGIYRKPDKEEVKALAVAEPLLARYAAFLKEQNTGIVKLNAESSCISDADVLVASEVCSPYKIPGAGTSYSFRTESYRLPRIADLILFDEVFRTGGVYQHVVLTELGDIAIGDVTLESNGLRYLVELKPVRDSDEFMKFDKEIGKGIDVNGFPYRKGYPVSENSTFALRSIAYRGKFIRSIDGIQYDELEFDRRRDVIVVFRVIEKDAAGNYTIVWKRLKDVEAPTLKVKK